MTDIATPSAARRMYDADEVDAYASSLRTRISALQARLDIGPGGLADVPGALMDRTAVLAQRAADTTIDNAWAEASAIVGRAKERADQQVIDAEREATLLVTSARDRIESLLIGWDDHLDRATETPCQPIPPPVDALPVDALPVNALPVNALPVNALPVNPVPVDPVPVDPVPTVWVDRADPPVVSRRPRHSRPHRFGFHAWWNVVGLSRFRASRANRTAWRKDPFFNVELRWAAGTSDVPRAQSTP